LHALTRFAAFIDAVNDKIGVAVSWLTTILMLVVCYDVFTRYLLKSSSIAVQELEWHFFAIIFLLGAAYTLRHDRHVRVDVIYLKFSTQARAWINFAGCIVFLIPFAILVIWASNHFVVNSFRIGETSPDPGGLPARYLLKVCVPLGFLLLLLQGIALAIQSLSVVLNRGSQSANEEWANG
jgi:TRAP-type mannitol/chloroaromatic compound transport system permease small subunit